MLVAGSQTDLARCGLRLGSRPVQATNRSVAVASVGTSTPRGRRRPGTCLSRAGRGVDVAMARTGRPRRGSRVDPRGSSQCPRRGPKGQLPGRQGDRRPCADPSACHLEIEVGPVCLPGSRSQRSQGSRRLPNRRTVRRGATFAGSRRRVLKRVWVIRTWGWVNAWAEARITLAPVDGTLPPPAVEAQAQVG